VPTRSRPLDGRVALVTGANHGIGAAAAVQLARLGADVVVSFLRFEPSRDPSLPEAYDRDRGRDGATTVAGIEAAGQRGLAVEADLADVATPAWLFDQAEAALGPVSILVHNASGWRKDSFAGSSIGAFGRRTQEVLAETFDAQFLVDTRAGALLIAELARRHRQRGATWGRVVTLTSGGPDGFPGEASYGAAKAALDNYVMTAARELAGDGITANVVYPPVTDTGWVTEAVREHVAASDDHFHVADPDDIAPVIGWLCTDDARLVTGNVVRLR
jgi:3-oxoacyl-[acyl-carrier protein] reductase